MIEVKTIRKPKPGRSTGGGSGRGSGFASAGSSDYAEKAAYASQAGNAETAEYASRAGTAGVAEGLTQGVWNQINEKDAAALNAAKEYANGNFLSKKNDDTAQGFLSFLAGIGIGPAETWGYVKKVTENGAEKIKSWFKNLWTDVLTVSAYIKGENGTVNIESNLYGTGSAEFDGDLHAEGGIHSGGDVVADNNICGVDGSFSRDVDVKGTVTTQNLKVTGIAEFFKLIIDELRAAGGAQLYTAADGFAVEAVTRFEYDGGHRRRLWWRATDGKKATQNKWLQGMQAVCMNFNAVTAPGEYNEVSNHQFWAVVAWCGTATGENGAGTTPEWNNSNPAYVPGETNPYEVTHWHFIDLYCGETASSIDTSTNNEYKRLWKGDIYNVAVGDEIAMLGYRPNPSDYVNGELSEDARRLQSAVYISAYSSYDDNLKAPFLAFYQGIDDFDLSSHRKTYIDAFGSKFFGDFFADSSREGLAGLLSTLEVGLNGIRGDVSSLPLSRNMLLNTDFSTLAEINRGCIHLIPTKRWQGYKQVNQSSSFTLRAGTTYRLTFYAHGTGSVGAIAHLFTSSPSGAPNEQFGCSWPLTPVPTRYELEITPTANSTFIIHLGSNSNQSNISNTEIYISRPQLKQGAVTDWTNTFGASNRLRNSLFGNVGSNGIPQDWEVWDNYEGVNDSLVPPTRREIVNDRVQDATVAGIPNLWTEWNDNASQGYSFSKGIVLDDGMQAVRLGNFENQFQGIKQYSSTKWNGTFKKELKHGGKYSLSFFAKGSGRVDVIVHFLKINADGTNGGAVGQKAYSYIFQQANVWEQVSFPGDPIVARNNSEHEEDLDGYGFTVMIGCVHDEGAAGSEYFYIAHPQLEEGETATEWRRGEENVALMQTRFEQIDKKIELGVYRDGVKRSGMKIDEYGVEFDGDRVRINGDLDLQGLMTENVTIVGRNESHPTIINMGVGVSGDDVVKSVQVTSFTPYENDYGDMVYDEGTHMVVLPFYDDIVTRGYSHPDNNEYWPNRTDISFSREDGSFLLSLKDDIPLCKRKVVEWRKNGTRLTVSNEFINRYRNWHDYQGSDPYEGNSMPRGLVVVCADGRIVASENIRSNRQFNPSEMGGQDDNILHGGSFSCMGRLARFIVLLPGQTLQLRSQIVTVGSFQELDEEADTLSTEARRVLIWVVENPTEFEPLLPRTAKLIFDCQKDRVMYSLEYLSGLASYNTVNTYHSWNDTILAPAVLNKLTGFDEDIGIEW